MTKVIAVIGNLNVKKKKKNVNEQSYPADRSYPISR